MGLNLAPKLSARLRTIVVQALETITATFGRLDFSVAYTTLMQGDKSLEANGSPRPELVAAIGEDAFTLFVVDWLSEELRQHPEPNMRSQIDVPLRSLAPFRNPEGVAERLVADFESLPWAYSFIFPLPPTFQTILAADETLAFGSKLRLVGSGPKAAAEFPLPQGLNSPPNRLAALLSYGKHSAPDTPPSQYLQLAIEGFARLPAGTDQRSFSIVRAFLGLGIALGLVNANSYVGGSEPQAYAVYRWTAGGWSLVDQVRMLPPAMGEIYARMAGGGGELSASFKGAADRIACVFDAGPQADRLLLAAEWLFNSYSRHDELLAFVQAVVVLEILLGDKKMSDLIGIGELMRNRCAYLLGRTPAERDQILKTFNAIYTVRSNVVHGGKKHLNSTERRLFRELQSLCVRVIGAEVQLLVNELENTAGQAVAAVPSQSGQ